MKRILFAAFVLGVAFSASAFAQFNGFSNNLVWSDPPGRVFPGKYFEYKAQFYLHKHDYRFALDMFELAGFWANKRAQYNTGIMYFNGIGVPVDKARGAAWLGIAAENHDDLTVAMLQSAYAQLSDSEKQQAQNIWQELDGIPFNEIAQRTGENVQTLVSRKRYAVLHLRNRLKQLYEEITEY